MEERSDVDVLVCGAGAAGLTLAIELARRGVAVRIVDKIKEPFGGSRGKGIQPRTQEVFEDLGIIDRVVASGGVYPIMREYRDDGSYAEKAMFEPRAPTPDVPYFIPLMIPQCRTEEIMRGRLAELGGQVEYGRALLSFEQYTHGVEARLACDGGEEIVRARFLIGADGGRSFVRHALEIGFPGNTMGVRAIVADVSLTGLDRDAWHQFNDGDLQKLVAVCPLGGTDLFQIQMPIPLEGTPDLSAAGLQAVVRERTGRNDIEFHSVAWASAYSMNARLADRYRSGRVFLVGDSAHIHPPTGGQGLNTSVQDSYNLGWKIAAVVNGAPVALLDTYEEERRKVAEDVLGLSTRLLTDQARQGGMRRGRDTHQLDIEYRESSLSLDAGGSGLALRAGDRMPDAVLHGAAGRPRRLFEVTTGTHWTLFVAAPAYPPIAARAGLKVCTIGTNSELGNHGSQLGLVDGEAILVRPDGYVGATFDATGLSRLNDYLSLVLPPIA